MVRMTKLTLVAFFVSVLSATAAVHARDEPAAPPAQPAPTPDTPAQAAEKVVVALAAQDAAGVKALAARDDPDPWLVADELLFRRKAEAADVFARAAPRKDTERLPAYVASVRDTPYDVEARQALAAGNAELPAEKWAEALAALDRAKPAGVHVVAVRLDHGRGFALRGLGRSSESADAFRRAGRVAESLGWLARSANAFHEAGMSFYVRGAFPAALPDWQAQLRIEETRAYEAGISQVLTNLGVLYKSLGESRKALDCNLRVLELDERLGDRAGVAIDLGNLGGLYQLLGDYAKALEYGQRALRLDEELGDAAGVASDLTLLAFVHTSLGQQARALNLGQRALEGYEKLGNPVGLATALGCLGGIYESLGDHARALEFHGRALAINERIHHGRGVATDLMNMGIVREALGEFQAALDLYVRALKIAEDLGNPVAVARCLLNISHLHGCRADYAQALAFGERALKAHQELGDRLCVPADLAIIALAHEGLGRDALALEFRVRALDGARATGSLVAIVPCLCGMAWVHRAAGRPREAISWARQAVEALSAVVRGLAEEHGASARSRYSSVFDVGAAAAATLGDADQALFFLESGRAGALLESLKSRGAVTLLPPQLAEAEAAARARQASAAETLRRATQHGDAEAERIARTAVDEAQRALFDVISRIQREAKAAADVAYPKADSTEAIRGRLQAGEALVLYGLPGESFWSAIAVVVTAKEARVVSLASTAGVQSACVALKTADEASDVGAQAVALRKLVIDPLQLDTKITRLFVSPDGALSYVPFTLLAPELEIVYVPSGTTYGVLLADASKKGQGILAIGDPDYGARPAPDLIAAAEVHRGAMNLVPLPATGAEAKVLGTTVLLGKGATEQGLREALAKNARWRAVHLACHGLVDPDRPMLSSLALTPGGDDDGFLTVLDVFRMKMPADLAVLSACETGKGRVYRAEGIVGLTRAFMYAGAPRVLVSSWKVDDAATLALMTRFYAAWNAGLPAVRALREAQQVVAAQEAWRHPKFWAAWSLWGLPE